MFGWISALCCMVFSADGVPFLMHDRTLIRTTDVEEQFPSRKDDCACSFNISEIQQLDAGKWFLEVKTIFDIF